MTIVCLGGTGGGLGGAEVEKIPITNYIVIGAYHECIEQLPHTLKFHP